MKTILTKKTKFTPFLLAVALMALVSMPLSALAFTQLTGTLGFGATGANVTNLQTFLASSASIYPQGLVTGYFGVLTQQAVKNFQASYGISQVGVVGPITMAKINSLIASGTALVGGVIGGADVNAPIIYSPMATPSATGAVISWSTSEPATAEVYYSTTPFQLTEALGSGEPSIVGGTDTGDTTALQTFQNISLQNLLPNTLYYYVIESTDASGNLQYVWPATFITHY